MLICATLWSTAGIFIKLIPWNGFAISGIRSLIAGATIGVYMLIKRYRLVVTKKTLLCGLMSGLLYTAFVCSNKLTTAANAIVLQFTSPVFIVVFSAILYKTPIRKQDVTVVLFTLLGVSLCFFDKLETGYMLGNVVSVLSGMCMACMFMIVGNLEGEARYSGIFLGQMVTFLIGLPFIIVTKPEFAASAMLYITILGVFQLGISYILYIKSTRCCPPLACCLLGAVEPLLNPVWVMLFDGERPGILALIGGLVVIASVTLWCIFGKEKADA